MDCVQHFLEHYEQKALTKNGCVVAPKMEETRKKRTIDKTKKKKCWIVDEKRIDFIRHINRIRKKIMDWSKSDVKVFVSFACADQVIFT